jgi:hypothetical protein
MKKKYLSIVLLEDTCFKEVVMKIEKAFGIPLLYKNKKGRYIAEGIMENYKISVVDRIDDLGEFLTDDYHALEIVVDFDDSFDQEGIENNVINKLSNEKIAWKSGIWSKNNKDEEYRKIYPI